MPGLLAGMATRATGMAHPRQTTLATMTRSLSESIVGSMASARSLDVHSDKTHRMSGAKAGAERSDPVAEPLSEALADGGESARERQSGDDCVPASALGGYGSERRKASPLDCTSVRCDVVCRRVR